MMDSGTREVSSIDMGTSTFTFVSREQWQAREPIRDRPQLKLPLPYVVIHHSYIPSACFDKEQCCAAVRQMQDFHMDQRKFADIGYNFAVGSDGVVYEGRGWTIEGSQALNFNAISLGICLIGDWSDSAPPPEQITATKALIAVGVTLGYLAEDYKLIGHRQVKVTECPGAGLFELIKTWEHYSSYPASVYDLLDIKELPDSRKDTLRQNLKQ